MLVLFGCIVVGFFLKKFKKLPSNGAAVMSKLETYVFVPALTLSTFMNYCSIRSLREHSALILYSCIGLAVAMAIAIPLSGLFVKNDPYKRNIYKYALTFANSGFVGNAIVVAILSGIDSGILFKYLLFTLPINVAIYSWGLYILIPHGEGNGYVLKNLMNPSIIAMAIGAVLGLTGAARYVPSFLVDIIDSLKACMAPVAMVLTGFIIGGYSIKEMLKDKKVYVATFLWLLILPSVILGLLRLLEASDLVIEMAFFAYATPLGLNTVVFPAAYGGDAHTGASMAAISHTLSVITIPFMFLLLKLFLKFF